ncbi:MAG: bifunctional phosphopantothenoylcysteine decarboxylase/phosphopantothenate--cysteine ligase CoaBC [Desulfovibrio sp.]|nr:bifunctional phosphopantothenoylcysteine decarboxylase/phosphopantothenate--cysteine ligase CoaBC [Desulfovibrio sp.]
MAELLFTDSTFFKGEHLHLTLTGSVACYKGAELLRKFKKIGLHVAVTLSRGALQFVTPLLFEALGAMPVYSDLLSQAEGPFAHLEPGQQSKAMLIAPASANMLAKLAQGLACDLASTQALAFAGPLLLAPAMNPKMWQNPALQANLKLLQERGASLILPECGTMACGESGQGRLAELAQLFYAALRALAPKDLSGQKVLITLGPTREYWDAVRFWSNPSSGRMGACLAICAWLRGASVYAVKGPGVNFAWPVGLKCYAVQSAREMREQALKLWPEMDYALCAAAVADFAPVRPGQSELKVHKQGLDHFNLEFTANEDILLGLVQARKVGQKILAFAAETCPDMESLLLAARNKLKRKGADVLAANRVNSETSGFQSSTNSMAVVDATGREELWPLLSKADVAWRLWSWLLKI